VDIDLPAEDDPRRVEVRAWFEAHPSPTPQELRDAGYVVPHWPKPWGLDAEPELQLIIDDEMKRAGVSRPINPIGTGHCGPIIVLHGTDEQKQQYLPPMLTGEEIWCQLFSEPSSGSDLANLRTRAVRDGDVFIVNGQKIWTSLAQVAKYGILIARTEPDAPKYRGISYFIVPMDSPGIEIRPIRNMTGEPNGELFCEIFFTDVAVPADNLIGELNNGWAMAKDTLANERVSLSSGGIQFGHGPTAMDLVNLAREKGLTNDPLVRQRLAEIVTEDKILKIHKLRQISKDILGAAGMMLDNGPAGEEWASWGNGFLFSPALTIGGGTSEVLRNIIAERMLGLPHDIDVEMGKTWAETGGNV
jgi:3-oxochol-4-en-24-oyl-CoA dehydrogenase